MTLAQHTGAVEPRSCSRCGAVVPHREVEALSCGPATTWWRADQHTAPCGRPCISGGANANTKPWNQKDRCPVCGPLRVLPDMAEEMRGRAEELRGLLEQARDTKSEPTRSLGITTAWATYTDLLRALDEIALLTREREALQEHLDEAREQVTALRMELADREIEATEADRGTLINLAAQASAHRVEAEEALARCPNKPERVAERERLKASVETAKAEEAEAQRALKEVDNGR